MNTENDGVVADALVGSLVNDTDTDTDTDGTASSTATLTLDITPANDAPTAADDSVPIDEDNPGSGAKPVADGPYDFAAELKGERLTDWAEREARKASSRAFLRNDEGDAYWTLLDRRDEVSELLMSLDGAYRDRSITKTREGLDNLNRTRSELSDIDRQLALYEHSAAVVSKPEKFAPSVCHDDMRGLPPNGVEHDEVAEALAQELAHVEQLLASPAVADDQEVAEIATPAAQEPLVGLAQDASHTTHSPPFLATPVLALLLDGVVNRDSGGWKKLLADCPAWLHVARRQPGSRGKRAALWDPVAAGRAVIETGAASAVTMREAFRRTGDLHPAIEAWQPAWRAYESDLTWGL